MAVANGVRNDEDRSCYVLELDEGSAIAAYRMDGAQIVFTHTEVPEQLEGRGVGSRLIAAALEDARQRGLRVVPACAFVQRYIQRHPEWQDLLA